MRLRTEHTPRRNWRLLLPREQGEESIKKAAAPFEHGDQNANAVGSRSHT